MEVEVAVHGGMTAATLEVNGQATLLWRFATLVAADDVVFLVAHGLTITDGGAPCYGCPGSPTSFWAYRPASGGAG